MLENLLLSELHSTKMHKGKDTNPTHRLENIKERIWKYYTWIGICLSNQIFGSPNSLSIHLEWLIAKVTSHTCQRVDLLWPSVQYQHLTASQLHRLHKRHLLGLFNISKPRFCISLGTAPFPLSHSHYPVFT